MVQQHFDDLERVVRSRWRCQGRLSPSRQAIGIDAVLEQPRDAVVIVPVGLAKQDHREAVVGELSAVDEDLQAALSRVSGA